MASNAAKRQMASFARLGMTERVVYRHAGELPRPVTAMVERGGTREILHAPAPALTVTALNDAAEGIATANMDLGTDRLDVAERIGVAPVPRAIQRVLSQDEDFLTVEVA